MIKKLVRFIDENQELILFGVFGLLILFFVIMNKVHWG